MAILSPGHLMSIGNSVQDSTTAETGLGDTLPKPPIGDTLRQAPEEIERSRQLSVEGERAPASVPGYTLIRRLGEGAYGAVWLAVENQTNRKVAVKFYTHRGGLDWSLLNREVEKLAVLYTSRNIVRLMDVGWDSDPPYYVMEHLENGSLEQYLSKGPLPAHEAVRIARSVLQALVHAHGSGILHCDLKPANVLLDPDFEPRICDFGQSRLSNEQNPALGTLFYMAPEQASLRAVPDARWDVYALGALLYHMLCGEVPYRTRENEDFIQSAPTLDERLAIYRRVIQQSPMPTKHREKKGVDKRLAHIVERCLNPDPKKRFPNAQAVLDALDLRDRQRAIGPLVTLGVMGPLLVLLGIIPFALNAFGTSIEITRKNLTTRALESDALPASILAASIERDLDQRKFELAHFAQREDIRDGIAQAAGKPWAERQEVFSRLLTSKQAVDGIREKLKQSQDESWFITDRNGIQIWRDPFNEATYDQRYAHRDYFHGRGFEYAKDAVPADVTPITEPHISLPFRSEANSQLMVAISVPIYDAAGKEILGVMGRTTRLGKQLSDFAESLSGQAEGKVDRVIALVETDKWRILDHPWLADQGPKKIEPATFEKLTLDEATVAKLKKLQPNSQGAAVSGAIEDYIDPVGREFDKDYAEEWLAAFAPVGEAGWMVVVQERRSSALKPITEMPSQVIPSAIGAIAVGTVLVGLLWYMVLRALSGEKLVVGRGPRQIDRGGA